MKKIHINKYARLFFLITLSIAFLHFTLMSVKVLGRHQSIFYLDEEITLGAHFTTIIAFLAGCLFLLLSAKEKFLSTKSGLVNLGAGIFFVLLSYDEYLSLHEYLNSLVKNNVGDDSLIYEIAEFSWMAPLLVLVIAIFIMLILQIRIEPNQTVRNSYIAGLVSFFAVLILELAGGRTYGHWSYAMFVGVEETLEMIGICFYLNAALEKLNIGKLLTK